jgi:hypothetical protein
MRAFLGVSLTPLLDTLGPIGAAIIAAGGRHARMFIHECEAGHHI